MPPAVRKSVARNSLEHVSVPSLTPVQVNGTTPSTLVLNEMEVWRPEMRSSFAFAGNGGRAGDGDKGGGAAGGSGDNEPASNRRAAAVLAASTGIVPAGRPSR